MAISFTNEIKKVYPRLTISLEHLYSKYSAQEIEHDLKIEEEI